MITVEQMQMANAEKMQLVASWLTHFAMFKYFLEFHKSVGIKSSV